MEDLLKGLQTLCKNDINATILFRHLDSATNNRRETAVEVIAKRTSLKQTEVRKLFRELESLGIGTLILGRKTYKTRFQWAMPMKEVAAGALGTQNITEDDLNTKDWLLSEDLDSDDGFEIDDDEIEDDEVFDKSSIFDEVDKAQGFTMDFPIRKDEKATIHFPEDVTQDDVNRLIKQLQIYLESLPKTNTTA